MKKDVANLFDAAAKKGFLEVSVDLCRIHTSLHIVYSPSDQKLLLIWANNMLYIEERKIARPVSNTVILSHWN